MNEVRRIGGCTLIHGDALKVLPTLEPVDAIITDPPYRLSGGGKNTSQMSGKFSKTVYCNNGKICLAEIDWTDFMAPCYEAIGEAGHAYFMCNNRHVANATNAALSAGWRFHNLLVWNKRRCTPNRWYMKNLEFVVFVFKGRARAIADCGAKQLIEIPPVVNAPHPTQKPVDLMRVFIENSTQPGDVVLDPFMGHGSTGVACLQAGRKFVGIEIDRGHFEAAWRRIRDLTQQQQKETTA